MGMLEGDILQWLAAPGDRVEEGADLVEVEAAKTTEVVVSPATGTLREVLKREGETVPVGELLGTIDANS